MVVKNEVLIISEKHCFVDKCAFSRTLIKPSESALVVAVRPVLDGRSLPLSDKNVLKTLIKSFSVVRKTDALDQTKQMKRIYNKNAWNSR